MMDPRVSAMLRRQADEEMLLAQDRSRAAERTLSTYVGWLKHGIDAGFCGPAVCSTHDGIPTSEAEDLLWEEEDPCVFVIRPYTDPEHKAAVEENHSPSNWRKP